MADFVNPVWNVFEPQIDDRSITEYSYVRYATTEGLDVSRLNASGQLFRLVSKDLDSYLVPSKGLLDFTFKIVGSAPDATNLPANSIQMHDNVLAIFSKLSLMLNSISVEEVENPVLTNTIKNLLEYSPDYKNTQGPAQFFYTSSGDLDTNSDQVKRVNESKLVRVLVPLNRIFGFLESYTSATRGIEIRIEAVKEDDTNKKRFLFSNIAAPGGAQDAQRVLITEMSMWIPKASPSASAENHFLEIARNKDLNESISYEAWNGYRANVTIGTSTNINYQITTSSKKPKYVFVALQNAVRLNGPVYDNGTNGVRNPSIFDSLDVRSIALKLNSKRFPYETYKLDYRTPTATTAQNYERAYHDFLAILDKDSELDSGSCVSHAEYASKYAIYAFDVSKDISLFENVQSNYIEVEITLGTALVSPVNSIFINSCICWERQLSLQSDGSSLKLIRD